VLGASVHAASLHDREGAQRLLSDELKESLPRLELLWADGAYTGGFRRWAKEVRGWQVEVPRHRDRHEIEHLADPVGGQETCDQDSGVGKVQLAADVVIPIGTDAEVSAAIMVEQGSEDARGVETGQQNQSMVPSVLTRAAVCRSPIRPCSLMGGSDPS
jgi:hypothetical protein